MGREPALHRLDLVGIQHVDDGAALQVHHDRPVGPPVALRPFIDPDDLPAGHRRSGALLHPAQNGVVTDRHTEAATQSFPRPPAERMADHVGHDVRSIGPAPIDGCDARQGAGEKAHPARGLPAAPAADAYAQRHRGAHRRQIGEGSHVPTMARGRDVSAAGAGRLVRPTGDDRPAPSFRSTVVTVNSGDRGNNSWPDRDLGIVHRILGNARGATKVRQNPKSEAEPK